MDNMKIASELVRIAKELLSFWDLKIVPPTATDVSKAKNVVMNALKLKGMKCDKLEFQRFMSYSENVESHGAETRRNSNKHLCVFAFSDKDGTFGAGVAGGRIGENNEPKPYQTWAKVGVGADGEREVKRLVDAYIKKKTNQADSYKEVKL